MGLNSAIEWCDSSFSPWTGCQKVSPGCDHCYAEAWAERYKFCGWGPHADRRFSGGKTWTAIRRWSPLVDGHRRRIFSAELADIFDNKAHPIWRSQFFDLVRETPQFDWLILTKRPENMARMLPSDWGSGYPNVWLGVTAEDQPHYDRRWPILAATPAPVRFISYEPALGPLSIARHEAKPDWLIAGCESGRGARPSDEDWFRAIRDECLETGTAFFLKQVMRNRRKVSTPELDGQRWTQWP